MMLEIAEKNLPSKRQWMFMKWSGTAMFAYFDETGTHGDQAPITAVAGYLFSESGAELFRQMFQENVYPLLPPDRHGNKIYHSHKCIGGYDQFANLTPLEREHIVTLLVEAINKSITVGVVLVLPKEASADAIDRAPGLKSLAGDAYSQCLIRCIEYMAEWLDDESVSEQVDYIFEAGCIYQKEANRIFEKIAALEELKARYHWHSYSFCEKSAESPQLFAPDLLAWEWQRAHINAMNPHCKEWRLTLKTLFAGSPHIPRYLTSTSVGIRAIINAFYGLTTYIKEEH